MCEYRLIEIDGGRPLYVEKFNAPDDDEAVRRVRDVVETPEYELWRGGTLIDRQTPPTMRAAAG